MKTPVKVRDGEGIHLLHCVETLWKNGEKLAFSGSVQATRCMFQFCQETTRALEVGHQDNLAWVADYRVNYAGKAATCDRAGEAVPDWITRPEDIHCSGEEGLRIIGPYSPETLKNLFLVRRWRDALFIAGGYDRSDLAIPGNGSTIGPALVGRLTGGLSPADFSAWFDVLSPVSMAGGLGAAYSVP